MSLLPSSSDWTFELLAVAEAEINKVATGFGLSTYPNQFEIITSDQMLDAYSSIGMPIGYSHWSYGKNRVADEKKYKRGDMGLAYEIVINSNPCISYLMEENTLLMQVLVMAHAGIGHNSFFKNNYLFKEWTDADGIIDYLLFAKNYVTECEQKHGIEEVELFLDSCHALQNFGVDRYKRPAPLSMEKEKEKQKERENYLQSQVNDLWAKTIPKSKRASAEDDDPWVTEPQENILYFIEKNAPCLESWQRELIRIVRKISQYFYPQRQTQLMNEGYATFWHYTILNKLYDEDVLGDGHMMEFLQSHAGVTYQRSMKAINPYALGFAMYSDIKRMCQNPTEEDKYWFPSIAGQSDWVAQIEFAMRNFKDESFVSQYLSPKVIRDFHLFSILDDDSEKMLYISEIHNEEGYRRIREQLSAQYSLSEREPNIQVVDVDIKGDRSLLMKHIQVRGRTLNEDTTEVIRHVARLWGFDVYLDTYEEDGTFIKGIGCGEEIE